MDQSPPCRSTIHNHQHIPLFLRESMFNFFLKELRMQQTCSTKNLIDTYFCLNIQGKGNLIIFNDNIGCIHLIYFTLKIFLEQINELLSQIDLNGKSRCINNFSGNKNSNEVKNLINSRKNTIT